MFGRHVGERAHHDAVFRIDETRRSLGVGERFPAGELCQPEVQHLHVPVATDHDVLGLQVAVDDAGVVRRRDGLGDLDADGQRLTHLETAALEHGPQRDPVDVLRGEELHPGGVADVVDRQNVRVVERRDRAGFALESQQPFLVAERARREHFQRELAAQADVLGQIHLRHAAGSERRQHTVVS